jgi:hypothetical protein
VEVLLEDREIIDSEQRFFLSSIPKKSGRGPNCYRAISIGKQYRKLALWVSFTIYNAHA